LHNRKATVPLKFPKKGTKKNKEQSSGNSRFQRINSNKVLGLIKDNRLSDNSYYSKGGESWGAKAQQDLGVVKGDRFRHEKTKKKRGSYRGGPISTDVHSIPLTFSDEDE